MSFFNRLNKQFKEQKLHNLEEVRFQSGMTSEQKYQSITQSVLAKIDLTKQSIKGCPMHPKISKKCRKCNEIQSNLQKASLQEEVEVDDRFPEMIKVNTANMKSHFSQKLQKNIQDCYLFKSKLRTFNNVRDLVKDLTSDQISIDAYINGSTDTPTPFFCYFYRLTELRPTREQISIMLKANNVNVRCLALLYLRTYASPQIVYGCLCNSFKDNKLLSVVTVGQYAMRLFDQEQLNHGGFRLPRLPIKIQRAINKRIAKLKEQRQNQFERQRERSRERQRKRRQQYEEQVAPSKKRKESESQSEQERQYQQKPIIQKDEQPLSLKQRIRLMQKKKQEELRKKALLDSYRNENVNKLQSEEEAFSQNDDVQKFNVG